MSRPRTGSVLGESPTGRHRVAYRDWERPDADRTILCVHGLTGCARDFDVLAPRLVEAGYRAVCVDVVGRGDSGRLADPSGYQLRQYVRDLGAVLDHLGADEVDWVGTSMGGVIGMAVAARAETPVRRLVLNDIGPFVPTAALQRLGGYLGADPSFPDLKGAEAHLRVHRSPFGALTDEQWRDMAERTTRPDPTGGYRLHYDPAIAERFVATMHDDIDLWKLWDAIECPVLVLRGEDSDLLLRETANEMVSRGPAATVIEFGECGHNPALLDSTQIEPLLAWLDRD